MITLHSHSALSETVSLVMPLVCFRRRNRFQQRLRLLALRGRRIVTEAYFHHSQSKICPRRNWVAWVLERPQFCIENMVLNHYAGNICLEHFLIPRQTFHFISSQFIRCFDHTRGRFWWRSECCYISIWQPCQLNNHKKPLTGSKLPVWWVIFNENSISEVFRFALSSGQTIGISKRNISQHCWPSIC